jgi:hypothetical protein
MRSFVLPATILLVLASSTVVSAQERRDGARSPRVSTSIARSGRVAGEVREPRRFGYSARVYGGYDGYGYRPYRYSSYGYRSYGYRPSGYYRSYGYAPAVYGYRGDSCDW